MTPLLLVAALSSSNAFDPTPPLVRRNLDQAQACDRISTQTVAPNGVPFRKLGDLPWGVLEHAVWRKVEGCPVREVVYKGQTYYVGPSIPKLESGPAVEQRQYRSVDKITPITPDQR